MIVSEVWIVLFTECIIVYQNVKLNNLLLCEVISLVSFGIQNESLIWQKKKIVSYSYIFFAILILSRINMEKGGCHLMKYGWFWGYAVNVRPFDTWSREVYQSGFAHGTNSNETPLFIGWAHIWSLNLSWKNSKVISDKN